MAVRICEGVRADSVAIATNPDYAGQYVDRFRDCGFEPEVLTGFESVPPRIETIVFRPRGSAPEAVKFLKRWVKRAEGRRLLRVSGGPGGAMRLLIEAGLASDTDTVTEEVPQDDRPQREAFPHEGSWFQALIDYHDGGLEPDAAQAVCTEQAVSFKLADYLEAVRLWAFVHGEPVPSFARPPEAEPEPEADEDEEAEPEPEPDRPYLNDVPFTGVLIVWCRKLVETDPWLTSADMRVLAREHGIEGGLQGTFSKAVHDWRQEHGLGDIAIPRTAGLPRPARWTPEMGDDPAGWERPHMRPVPTIADLRAEITLWEQEVETLRQRARKRVETAIGMVRRDEVEPLAAEISRLHGLIEDKRRAVDEAAEAWSHTQEELETTQTRLAVVAQEEQQEQRKRKEMEREVETLKRNLGLRDQQITALQLETEDLIERLQAARARIDELCLRPSEGDEATLRIEIGDLQHTLRTREDACRQWKKRAEAAETAAAADAPNLQALRRDLRAAEKMATDAQADADAARRTATKAQAATRSHESALERARRTARSVEAERDGLQARVLAVEEAQEAAEEARKAAVQAHAAIGPAVDPYVLAEKAFRLMQVFGEADWPKIRAALENLS